jgi:hypothetical protein
MNILYDRLNRLNQNVSCFNRYTYFSTLLVNTRVFFNILHHHPCPFSFRRGRLRETCGIVMNDGRLVFIRIPFGRIRQ